MAKHERSPASQADVPVQVQAYACTAQPSH